MIADKVENLYTNFFTRYGSSYIKSYTVAGYGKKNNLGLFIIFHGHFAEQDMVRDWKNCPEFRGLKKDSTIKGVYTIYRLQFETHAAFYRKNMFIIAAGDKSQLVRNNLKLLVRRMLLSKRVNRLPVNLRDMYKSGDLNNQVLIYAKSMGGLLQKGLSLKARNPIKHVAALKLRIKDFSRGLMNLRVTFFNSKIGRIVYGGWGIFKAKMSRELRKIPKTKLQDMADKILAYLRTSRISLGKSSGKTIYMNFPKPVNILLILFLLMG